MNILMVTMQMDIGGAETHILELCRALHRKGHYITLVSNGGVYADMLAAEGIGHVTLPLHTCLTDEQVEYIIANYTEVVKQYI